MFAGSAVVPVCQSVESNRAMNMKNVLELSLEQEVILSWKSQENRSPTFVQTQFLLRVLVTDHCSVCHRHYVCLFSNLVTYGTGIVFELKITIRKIVRLSQDYIPYYRFTKHGTYVFRESTSSWALNGTGVKNWQFCMKVVLHLVNYTFGIWFLLTC